MKGKNKIAWVKCERVCKETSEGGLVVKDVRLLNLALLAKWKWTLFHESGGCGECVEN